MFSFIERRQWSKEESGWLKMSRVFKGTAPSFGKKPVVPDEEEEDETDEEEVDESEEEEDEEEEEEDEDELDEFGGLGDSDEDEDEDEDDFGDSDEEVKPKRKPRAKKPAAPKPSAPVQPVAPPKLKLKISSGEGPNIQLASLIPKVSTEPVNAPIPQPNITPIAKASKPSLKIVTPDETAAAISKFKVNEDKEVCDIAEFLVEEEGESSQLFEIRSRVTKKLFDDEKLNINGKTSIVIGRMLAKKLKLGVSYDPDVERALNTIASKIGES